MPVRCLWHAKTLLLVFTILLCFFLGIPSARSLVGDSDGAFGIDGSLRTIGALFLNYDFPAFFGDERTDGYLQALIRITGAGRPRDDLSYEVHLVQALTYFSSTGQGRGSGSINLAGDKLRYRALDEASAWWTDDDAQALLWLDRCNVKIALGAMDLTIGRQAVTFGKAHFWNPLDVYLPFDPNQFDRDYKPGVDALRADLPLGDFSGITLVGVLGREVDDAGSYVNEDRTFDASWYGSSILGRVFTNHGGWDLALQGGKIYGGYQVGGGLVGEIRGVEVRAEAVWFLAQDSPPFDPPSMGDLFEDHPAAVIGLGRRFENSLILEIEYLFNGGGESEDFNRAAVRLERGAIRHMGRHLAGLLASYELTPLVVGQLTALYALSDGSLSIQPSMTFSLSNNSELLAGAGLYFGRRPETLPTGMTHIRSEFGSYPHFFFAEFKVYF